MNRRTCLLLATLVLGACQKSRSEPPTPRPEPAAGASHDSLPASKPIEDASLYELSIPLVDQDDRSVGLDTFAGKPVLISMFYGSCPYACPLLLSDIKRVLAALSPEAKNEVRVLLVSFDPERDKPEALKQLAGAHHVDGPGFRLTSAPEPKVRELAAVLGIKYRKLENGAINHSSVVTLLDRQGHVRARVDHLGEPAETLAREIEAIARERVTSR